MSTGLTTNKVKIFDDMVKLAYQTSGSNLKDTVRVKNGIKGESVQFPLMGKGIGVARGTTQTNIIEGANSKLMNITHSNVTANLTGYVFPELTDMFDQAEVNYNEQSELSKVITMAMGRRVDQTVIAALVAGTPSTVAGSGATTGLTVAKLIAAKIALDKKGVPTSDRVCVLTPHQIGDLLNTTKVTDVDYNTVKTLVNGEVDTFLGFKFISIEDRAEGGLPLSSAQRQIFFYHKMALGLAISIEPTVKVDWIPEHVSYLANGMLDMGAVMIDPDGVYQLEVKEL